MKQLLQTLQRNVDANGSSPVRSVGKLSGYNHYDATSRLSLLSLDLSLNLETTSLSNRPLSLS